MGIVTVSDRERGSQSGPCDSCEALKCLQSGVMKQRKAAASPGLAGGSTASSGFIPPCSLFSAASVPIVASPAENWRLKHQGASALVICLTRYVMVKN
ncbi:hypothetical protein E2C01_036021 [Portunus trituberculatus]|uniref:Uncharacterized protein n=1 Tax=Portunus trituberculatus TaxID=210409 RepID=A0A5B7F4Q8_PORTR|nr:hypothetical protein [Portunus trituberculatus]